MIFAAALLVAPASSGSAQAASSDYAVLGTQPNGQPMQWAGCEIPWTINMNGAPTNFDVIAVITGELAEITRHTGIPFRYVGSTSKSATRYSDGSTSWGAYGNPVLVSFRGDLPARGTAQPLPRGGPWFTSGVVWISSGAWSWNAFASTVSHEFGHIVGLADVGRQFPSQHMGTGLLPWKDGDVNGLSVLGSVGRDPGRCDNDPYGPYGTLDDVTVAGSKTVRVSGWTADPDSTQSLKVHVYVDGKAKVETTADLSRPDVGRAVPGAGNERGYDTTISVTPGRHDICVYALNVGRGADNPQLGCKPLDTAANPIGSLDAVTARPGSLTARGWTLDPNSVDPIEYHVYANGVFKGSYVADGWRGDIGSAYPGFGNNHGFEATFPIQTGTKEVCVFAMNAGAGSANPSVGCRKVVVDDEPIGSLDGVSIGNGTLTARGWALDADTPNPIKVHVYANGVFKGEFTASRDRDDIGKAFPFMGDTHGFDATFSIQTGTKEVCVYAMNAGAGNVNPRFACRTVVVR